MAFFFSLSPQRYSMLAPLARVMLLPPLMRVQHYDAARHRRVDAGGDAMLYASPMNKRRWRRATGADISRLLIRSRVPQRSRCCAAARLAVIFSDSR